MEILRKSNDCPAYLELKNGETVNFVLEWNQAKAISNLKDATLRHLEIVVEGKKYRALFNELQKYPRGGWPVFIRFKQFIPGESNTLQMPLRLKYQKEFWKMKGFRAEKWNFKTVEVSQKNHLILG